MSPASSPSPGTLPSHPEQDPEVKLLRVTAQRRRCAPPRPSGHCRLAGSPSARATAGEETGGGEREVPRGAVCKVRPSLLGVPACNHEWEPRELRTLTAAEGQAPALPATATGCHCSRAAEPAWSRREDQARVPGSRKTRACRARGVLPGLRPLEAQWCLDAVFRPPTTSPISKGLHPAQRFSMKNKLIIPLLRDR